MKNNQNLHGIWRTVKYFTLTSPLSKIKDLFVSVGLLITLWKVEKKTIQNGLTNFNKNRSTYWMGYKDREAINIRYESIPAKTRNKLGLPLNGEEAYNILIKRTKDNEDYAQDAESQSLYLHFEKCYEDRWPPYIKNYRDKIKNEEDQIRYAKSHALILAIQQALKEKWPRAFIFEAYRRLIIKLLDNLKCPVLQSVSSVYFWRKISAAKFDIPSALLHDSLGVPKEYRVKMTGQIKARIRLLMRNPKRFTSTVIIKKIEAEFKVLLSKTSVLSLVKDNSERNFIDYYRNGQVWNRQNGLPHLTKALAIAPGDQFQGDFYKLQFICRTITGEIIRLWAFIILDIFTKKAVGWALGREKCQNLALKAFKMAFTESHFLPEEIVVDNESIFKKPRFKTFIRRITGMGVIWTFAAPNSPTWKAEIEGFFGVFQKLHSDKPWYIGESVKSRNKSGNPAQEFAKLIKSRKKDMLLDTEMSDEFGKMLLEYNGDEGLGQRKKKLTPNYYFNSYSSKTTIPLEEWVAPMLFWKSKKKLIKQDGRIDIQIEGESYIYQTTKADIFWAHKNSYVEIRYNKKDLSFLYLFERKTHSYIGKIEPRQVLTKENKNQVLGKHGAQLKAITGLAKYYMEEDYSTYTGNPINMTDLTKSLEQKILEKEMNQQRFEEDVANVVVHE